MVAEDLGRPSIRRSIATLDIQVTDRNDHDPIFTEVSPVACKRLE